MGKGSRKKCGGGKLPTQHFGKSFRSLGRRVGGSGKDIQHFGFKQEYILPLIVNISCCLICVLQPSTAQGRAMFGETLGAFFDKKRVLMKGLTSMISRVSECNAVVGARDINGILPLLHRPAGVAVMWHANNHVL